MCFVMVVTGVFLGELKGNKAYATQTKTEVKKELDKVKDKQDSIKNQKLAMIKDLRSLQDKVATLNMQYKTTIQEIVATKAKIEKKQKEMEIQEENLNERLAVMYKNGSVGFVDVLLGSNSISEFVSNVEIIKKIYRNDVKVLKLLKREHKALEIAKANLRIKKEQLVENKKETEKQQKKIDAILKELKKEEEALKADAARLYAELARVVDTQTQYVGGQLAWPVPSCTFIYYGFGNRKHPVYGDIRFHTGIDITGGGISGQPIVAAGNGTVRIAGVYGGYGYCVVVDHGGGVQTLYGHCSRLNVAVGASVVKGQTIAAVGSTGVSTGPHLHFEVLKNGAPVDPVPFVRG